jgi:hypothetical protein
MEHHTPSFDTANHRYSIIDQDRVELIGPGAVGRDCALFCGTVDRHRIRS